MMETQPPLVSKRTGLLEGIKDAFRALYEAIQILQNGKVITPLLLYLVLKILVIVSFIESGTGGLHDIWSLLLPGRQAVALEHYPHHVMLLPVAMERLDILLDVFVHIIAQGMTILLVAAVLREETVGVAESLRATLRRYWHLVVVMIVALAAMLLAANLPYLVPIPPEALPHRHIPTAAGICIGLAVQSLFLYAVPMVLLSGLGGFASVRGSVRFALRRYPASLTLAVVTFMAASPTFLLGFKSQVIALRLFPELLIYIQVTAEVLQFVSTYLLVGGVTVLFSKEYQNVGSES